MPKTTASTAPSLPRTRREHVASQPASPVFLVRSRGVAPLPSALLKQDNQQCAPHGGLSQTNGSIPQMQETLPTSARLDRPTRAAASVVPGGSARRTGTLCYLVGSPRQPTPTIRLAGS